MPREYQFPFELRHLVYFREVARHLHFRKAAETLNIAQPALSRQIAQMESEMGVQLFVRTQRKVELSPAGKVLLDRIEPLLRGLSSIPGEMKAVAQGLEGHIRISFTGLAMATVLPGILREFHRKHPGIRLELNESPTSNQIAALRSGEIACGFFHPDSPTPGIRTRLLLRERNGVLLPADHALADQKSLRLADLAHTPFVLFPRSHNPGFYDRVIASFSLASVAPRIAEEVWPRSNAMGLVMAGLGATFMAPSEARNLPAEIRFLQLEGPAPESRLVMGWKEEVPHPGALAAFLDVALTDSRARQPEPLPSQE